jgi:hypothetical protein
MRVVTHSNRDLENARLFVARHCWDVERFRTYREYNTIVTPTDTGFEYRISEKRPSTRWLTIYLHFTWAELSCARKPEKHVAFRVRGLYRRFKLARSKRQDEHLYTRPRSQTRGSLSLR